MKTSNKLYKERLNNTHAWIQTYTGKQFYPFRPEIDKIDIVDIAHALSNLCRYTGHSKIFYSVGLHSVYVSDLLPEKHKLWGLLHDASEAYLADMASPIKKMFPTYIKAEERLMKVIATKFGLEWPMPPEVLRADYKMLATEKSQLLGRAPAAWGKLPKPATFKILDLLPTDVETAFSLQYHLLTNRLKCDKFICTGSLVKEINLKLYNDLKNS
jgi:uncharacterized protein